MKFTENYNLKKPDYTDIADIPEHFNGNMDTIDTELKKNADDLVAHKDETIHQGKHGTWEATSTDDATSVTNAPLKTSGGLAVAKKIYVGESTVYPYGGVTDIVGDGRYIKLNIGDYTNNLGGIRGKQLKIRMQLPDLFYTFFKLVYRSGSMTQASSGSHLHADIGVHVGNQSITKLDVEVLSSKGMDVSKIALEPVGESDYYDLVIKEGLDWWNCALEIFSSRTNPSVEGTKVISYWLENREE